MVRTADRPTARPLPAPPQRKVFFLVGLLIAAFLIFFPTKQLIEQKVRMHKLTTQLDALQDQNRQLKDQVKALNDPNQLELLARDRLGLVKPGEQSYLFVPTPPPARPQPSEAAARRAWYLRWWDEAWSFVRGSGR